MSKYEVGNDYPFEGFLRERQILGDPLAHPHLPAIIPVSRSTWWRGVRSGKFPAPVKLGPRTTVWRARDIFDLVTSSGDSGNG